ncbi:MAG: sigma-70 family RNA polymerase sigma factor [Acidobacteriia bacterium]|nr:sigma-70 family RNA polymerase sigma factor [Terriglobia bacterium]
MESAPHTTFEAEAELIERMHGHDAGALAELFDRYGRLVYSVILRVVHDASMAEDLTQETFLRVWNRVRGFDAGKGKGSIGPWLLAIAHNCAIDYLRSAGGRPRNVVNFEDAEHPALQTDMEREILGSEQARQLKRAVEKLCPNQRQAIELSYFGGLSQLEVAQRMGHPLGTVKTWVRKALQNLRADLGSPACVDVG